MAPSSRSSSARYYPFESFGSRGGSQGIDDFVQAAGHELEGDHVHDIDVAVVVVVDREME